MAQALNVPLDVFLVRKLGVPGQSEFAMGAIASGGIRILNQGTIEGLHISTKAIAHTAAQAQRELERREYLYRGDRSPLNLKDRTVILVDDGLATGATMHAAAIAIRNQQPKQIIAAVPVSAPRTCNKLQLEVDEAVCIETPRPFIAVGVWYRYFSQITDAQVQNFLQIAAEGQTTAN
ncbi:MAG: phosphoribosyltransferase family protein [Cyanobacteria bacterium J06555_3]